MAGQKKAPTPTADDDPIAFWTAQRARARADASRCRTHAPSVVAQHVKLERDAWRELQSARAAAEMGSAASVDATLEAQFAAAQRMRKAAESAGSYVAATNLLRVESEIAERIRLRDELAVKAARKGMTEDDLVEALVSKIAAMPDKMRAKVVSRLSSTSADN